MEDEHRVNQFLSSNMKNNIVQFLLKNSHDGVLAKGAVNEAAWAFEVHRKTIYRIWKAATEMMMNGEPAIMVGKVKGYKHADKQVIDEEKVRNLSVLERSSYRKMAPKLGVSKTTLCRWVKEKQLRPHTNAVKPLLTDVNKLARLRWCLSQLQPTITQGKVSYHDMRNIVHIDEKWFYMTKSSDRNYILPDEDEPYRACKSKRLITKVMFMCVVSRPQFGENGETLFDGKLGIFPFTESVPAKRNSKNRSRGTMETKPIQAITKAVTRKWLITKVIPSFQAKWPSELSPQSLNRVFLTLQGCLTQVLEVRGGNNYKIPHMKKDRLERINELPNVLEVEEEVVREALEYIALPQNNDGASYDIVDLVTAFGY
ncbi:hypothetical protein AAHA92_15416 [Salvia divinorum]|uniref:DUF7769 domain-containing protein n=1 Tax=Salvia divinorum TaxID=28513 RepID=A0ABD1HF63_SALDI